MEPSAEDQPVNKATESEQPPVEEADGAPESQENPDREDLSEVPGADDPVGEEPAAPEAEGTAGELVESDTPSDVALDVPGFGLLAALLVTVVASVVMLRGRRTSYDAFDADEDDSPGLGVDKDGAAAAPVVEHVGLAARLRERMAKSRAALQESFDSIFGGAVDDATLEALEEALLIADVGVPTTERILERVRKEVRRGEKDPAALREVMRSEIRELLTETHTPFEVPGDEPLFVLLVVGVNGSGKTTTIGKLAARFGREGKKVMLAAGDTYRAAAAEQLTVWSERVGADIVAHKEGADPGAVIYDALDAAKARGCDVLIVDTAGRLQTKKPLMEQLTKIRRIIAKKVPTGPHETLLVLDGTMGQNAMSQARNFHEATPLSGLVVTKLDGTAKGGVILAAASEMGLPVKFIGIGEQVDDLRPFEPEAFVTALA